MRNPFQKSWNRNDKRKYALALLIDHFAGLAPEDLVTSSRKFPLRMRADIQIGIDAFFEHHVQALKKIGLHQPHNHGGLTFAQLWEGGHGAVMVGALQHIEVDAGQDRPIKCLKNALWFLEQDGLRHILMLSEAGRYGDASEIQIEIAMPAGEEGGEITAAYFDAIEAAVRDAGSYRGKVLSLERPNMYSGVSTGILVHRLRKVGREDLVLPGATVDLLERNVFEFFDQREGLAKLGMSVKKGLLFYGPPGTGKTHTIHYLASRLQGHTTLLITAEQVGLLSEYMTLARLLQPSIVIIEDADLIARQRENMGDVVEEVLLNQLLNEMDGLREDSEILFILTTNRPETLESALAARPGRIDQAIEFPMPDDDGRRKLAALYAGGLEVPPEVMNAIVRRTDGVSASFIKELMRRASQSCLVSGNAPRLGAGDIDSALEELLVTGGRLNAALLGAGGDAA